MSEKTQLEKVLEQNEEYQEVRAMNGMGGEVQAVLDRISSHVCVQLSPEDIVAHVRTVYDEIAEEYAARSVRQYVPAALLHFMKLPHFRDGDRIIDLGCGPNVHDAIFLSRPDRKMRFALMGCLQTGAVSCGHLHIPNNGFDVLAVDGSPRIAELATRRLKIKKDEWLDGDSFFFRSRVAYADIHCVSAAINETFHGAWSCAALFTHTPRALIQHAFLSLAVVLEPKGIFAVSYPSGREGEYDNLRYQQQMGRVKYFSRPQASVIASEALAAGFHLIHESQGDVDRERRIQKDLFTTQFFQKC